MKWEGNRESRNVEDRRGMSGLGGRSIGIGGIAVALIASVLFGVDPGVVLSMLGGGPASTTQVQAPAGAPPSGRSPTGRRLIAGWPRRAATCRLAGSV